MRTLSASVAVTWVMSASVGAGQVPPPAAAQQQPASPVFRGGIELLTVDVTAIDNDTGRQVTDLAASDFVVEVDGNTRQVSSSEYVRSVDNLRIVGAPRAEASRPDETYFSSNAKGAPTGRLIVLLIDQGNIRAGGARPAMNSAKKFVDSLEPEDRIAVIAVPGPGELVDFTVDHDMVREALLRIVGRSTQLQVRFNLSPTEAIAVHLRTDARMSLEVILRECAQAVGASDLERCEREVEQDASQIVNDMRLRTNESLRGMRSVLTSLTGVEGPKSVVLVSEGLLFDGLGSETEEVAAIAADAQASLDVLLLDVPQYDATQSTRPTTPGQDRALQVSGLEMLAGAARGTLYRVNTTADFAFERISRAIAGYYLLGVESLPDDRNGRRHGISVKSTRRGVTIRSRRSFLTSISAKATTPIDAVTRALKSPLVINDLPIKVSTWTYKEPGTSMVRVIVAAEVERLAEQPLDYTAGMIIAGKDGRGFMPDVALKTLTVKDGDPGTAIFTSLLSVTPGSYRLSLALSDSEGRVGSISRAVSAWQMDGPGLTMGDLLLGGMGSGVQASLSPAIEPAVSSGQMGALMEMYVSGLPTAGLEATLEILADENRPPLATFPMQLGVGASPEILAASAAFSTATLPPGRYLARGSARQDGQIQGHLLRPFRIVARRAATDAGAPSGLTSGLPVELAKVLLGGLSPFDRASLLSPAMLTGAFATAEARTDASKAAITEARGGDLGAAAMTALTDGDQVLASFLKGLDLLQGAQLDRAITQFQSAMQLSPGFAPSRLYLGATLAAANRHREAAGLIQSGSPANAPNAVVAKLAGEEWLKAGQPALAIAPLEQALSLPEADAGVRQLLGLAYTLGGRPADAVTVLSPYLDANPTNQAALLAAIFSTYIRHAGAQQPATLADDRANVAKWAKAYAASKGPLQPLVEAWVTHLQSLGQ